MTSSKIDTKHSDPGQRLLDWVESNSRLVTMFKTLLICLACLTLVVNTAGQGAIYSADELQREVTLVLLDKNINDVTRQFDSESPSTVNSLLSRFVIYSRAGRTANVRKTLEQLSAHPDWRCPTGSDVIRLIRNADGGDFNARRFYYERLCPEDISGTEEFIRLWINNGNLKELDAWLAERSNRNDEWLMHRVALRAKSGTAGEVLDGLAADIRANPSDWSRLERYLRANNYAGTVQDVKWLADTFVARTAGDYFQFAERLRHYSPPAGAKLLEKSLDLPFTDADAKVVNDLISRSLSIGPSIKINAEKQLRYWTKRSLAETYQAMNQSLAAQPLVEELVSMKGDDILLADVHQLAGAVQGGSGQRVVETEILGNEVARRSTSEYWLERAAYYHGRDEFGLERDSYRQGLVALPLRPDDSKALNERFNVVRSFAFFLAEKSNDKIELEKLLTRELSSVGPETDYAFQIARLITQSELDLDALRNSLLAQRPMFFARLVDGRREWAVEEMTLIEDIVHREEVPSELKQKIWSSLEALVRDPGSSRAYHLADAMQNSDEWQRAIPLWRGYIKHASPTSWEGYKSNAITNLFRAYCRTKQWQAAEKILLDQQDEFWRVLPSALAEVALVAAQQNALADAMRLWRKSTNLDRRNLETLAQLAQTKARPQLVEMYSNMKKEDPGSTIPDLALRLLQPSN
jgi:tetratricopeptide (TPR) repeat protein